MFDSSIYYFKYDDVCLTNFDNGFLYFFLQQSLNTVLIMAKHWCNKPQ